jgi:phospholipid/cholesterol/gamma-HCH transport system substrate-binding protein
MNTRSSLREFWVGLIVLVALAGLIGLVGLASDGPGFLATRRTVDVVFRDGQGIRIGSPVRVAGLDAGNVVDVDLVEVEGTLRAQVRISLPASLIKKLRHDVKVTIVPGLTGMSHVNIVSAGKSAVGLVPGQPISGVETSFFDPIIEQVGLGPVERNHLSHTIAEVRQTVDSISPRLRQMLGSLQDTTTNLRELSDSIRPAVESTVNHVEEITKRVSVNSPHLEKTLVQVEDLTANANKLLVENRVNVRDTMASVRDLTANLKDVAVADRPKVEHFLDGLEGTRVRLDRVLYQADQIGSQAATTLSRSSADVERSVTNVRDATDWANKLVQKIFANPFVLSPFYKPNHEDLRVQAIYDSTLVFLKSAQELSDTVKTLDTMMARTATPKQQQELAQIQQRVHILTEQLNEISPRLAESLKRPNQPNRREIR